MWLFAGRDQAIAKNASHRVDETETLAARLLLTIEKRKVFLTAIFKSAGREPPILQPIEDEKSREKTGNRLSRKNKGD